MTVSEQVKKTICTHQLLHKGQKIVLGVSGGADSITLLYQLHKLQHLLGIKLHVAHLNHGLRKTAKNDQEFVKRQAQKLNIPFSTASIKIKKNKGSLEAIAREKRLNFLTKVAKKENAHAIALGHTKDDLAETVLMRLIRGSGLSGLRSILPKRTLNNQLIIRPLLETSRSEIENYLKKEKIKWVEDPSNKDTKFFRNKIRHKLLPLLEKEYNSNIRHILSGLANNVAVDFDFLEQNSVNIFSKLAKKSKNQVTLPIKECKKLHLSTKRFFIRWAISNLNGNTNALTHAHIDEVIDLVENRPVKSIVHLPKKVEAVKTKDNLVLRICKAT